MTLEPQNMRLIFIGGAFVTVLLFIFALFDNPQDELKRRLSRVGPQGNMRRITTHDRQNALRRTNDSAIPMLNYVVQFLPNPEKLRRRIARTGKELMLGEYVLMNALATGVCYVVLHAVGLAKVLSILIAFIVGFGLPHMVVGVMGSKRIKKFLANFPEAIDTMCRGIRSGLPVTESMASVGREMPDPVGIEFRRIADAVRIGKTLESSMWEVARRIDPPEYRFLIIAMSIQKETGGNLAETLGNLSELIRRRRQLRLKIKAMSSEAFASAMIIGSLPFIMFTLLMVVNRAYIMSMFDTFGGCLMLGVAVAWMCTGWAVMIKMINFEI
jgi:tight adherence protein B